MTVLPENLPDFGRWPSEDEVHERAEEGRSKDTGASDYNIEKAWKQTIEVLGFEDFKEDLAALLEVCFKFLKNSIESLSFLSTLAVVTS